MRSSLRKAPLPGPGAFVTCMEQPAKTSSASRRCDQHVWTPLDGEDLLRTGSWVSHEQVTLRRPGMLLQHRNGKDSRNQQQQSHANTEFGFTATVLACLPRQRAWSWGSLHRVHHVWHQHLSGLGTGGHKHQHQPEPYQLRDSQALCWPHGLKVSGNKPCRGGMLN